MRSFTAAALACLVAVVPAARAADEPDELMPGRVVLIKTTQVFKFVAKPPTGMTFDLPNMANDPTAEGGQLYVFDDDFFVTDSATFALPASGWKALGANPAGSKGYKYRGSGSTSDPCRVVLVKAGVVKAVCKGLAVSLPNPFTGNVGIVLTVGTDSKRYCAVFGFGSEVIRNDQQVVKAKNAPPPVECPVDVNNTTTVPPSTSTSTSTTTSTAPIPTTTSTNTSTSVTMHSTVTSTTVTTTTSTTLPPSATTTSTMGGPGFTTTSTFGTTVTSTSSTTTSTILVPCGEAEAPACMGGECPVAGTHCVFDGSSGCTCIFTTTTSL